MLLLGSGAHRALTVMQAHLLRCGASRSPCDLGLGWVLVGWPGVNVRVVALLISVCCGSMVIFKVMRFSARKQPSRMCNYSEGHCHEDPEDEERAHGEVESEEVPERAEAMEPDGALARTPMRNSGCTVKSKVKRPPSARKRSSRM